MKDSRWIRWGVPAGIILILILAPRLLNFEDFPAGWNLHLREPLDQFKRWVVVNRNTHLLFLLFFEPLSAVIDWSIRRVEDLLLFLTWPVLLSLTFLIAHKIRGLRLALLTSLSVLLMGLLGLWDESMETLAIMVVSVLASVALGLPLGILTARNDRLDRLLRPILDAMQTMPAFVYLIPVLLFFGIARVPSVVATVIYALPPIIRLTNLGIRAVPAEALEAAQAFGSTSRQILRKVQIPLALPAIMAGVNQTIMMALGIVVIAALIGSGGLGEVVLKSLRRLNVGEAFEAGLAIVFMAVLLDRLSQGMVDIEYVSQANYQGFRLFSEKQQGRPAVVWLEAKLDALYKVTSRLSTVVARWLAERLPHYRHGIERYKGGIMSLLCLGFLLGVTLPVALLRDFPAGWQLGLSQPIDSLVQWAQVNLYRIGDSNIGTGPFGDFLTINILLPLRDFLTLSLGWPVVMVVAAMGAWLAGGWRLALSSVVGMVLIGLLGMWELAMDTLSQVVVAVLLSIIVGVPLGIWAGRSDRVEQWLRLVSDFLQTIPPFVYLVPVIMLFSIGRVPGIIASVLYALPPVMRLTSLGIRQVDGAVIEAAEAFGSTSWQTLSKVQIPLALPAIMLGINQTIMMVLAMVIIAGLVGGAGLGLEVIQGLAQNELGRSVEAGLAIVIMAIVIDRISQAWAARQAQATNVTV